MGLVGYDYIQFRGARIAIYVAYIQCIQYGLRSDPQGLPSAVLAEMAAGWADWLLAASRAGRWLAGRLLAAGCRPGGWLAAGWLAAFGMAGRLLGGPLGKI